MREGINRKAPRILKTASESRGEFIAGKLALVRMGDDTAVACANYGSRKVPRLTHLARRMKALEVGLSCTVAALHIAGKDNAVADALPRFSFRVRGLGPYPERELRRKFRKEINARRGKIGVYMLASGDGWND